jgi:hypothetical protein
LRRHGDLGGAGKLRRQGRLPHDRVYRGAVDQRKVGAGDRAPPPQLEYKPGESKEEWLKQFGAPGSDVEPTRVPYYLLLAGGPEAIPFEIQFYLDIDLAVGRVAFDDPDNYRRYGKVVVDYETAAAVPNPGRWSTGERGTMPTWPSHGSNAMTPRTTS